MPVLTFANTKGGAGKTTTALIVASDLMRRGHKVTVIDADPRGWISRWHSLKGRIANLSIVSDVTAETITDAVSRAKKRGGYVLIDLPSSRDTLLATAIGLADHVLIPVQGCAMDATGGAEVLELLRDLDVDCNIRIGHSVVLTRVNAAVTTRALQAVKLFLEERSIATLSTAIAERAAYRDVFGKGGLLQQLDGTEVSNLEKALENATTLVDEVLALVPERMPRAAAIRKSLKAAA